MATESNSGKGIAKRISSSFEAFGRGLNYDFCPNFNRYVYWLKEPVGWILCGAAASFLVGLTLDSNGFILMWAFLTLIIIGAVWPWLCMKGISCRLTFDDTRSIENDSATAVLEVTNRWPLPVFGLMVKGQFLQDIFHDDDKIAIGLQRVPGWSVSKFKWTFQPRKRGKLPVAAPHVSNGFPFGIYNAIRDVEVVGEAVIWPSCGSLKGIPELEGAQFNIEGMMSDRPGKDGDVIGVRYFRDGDSLRSINWAKTAQKNRLIVQERQTCAQQPIQIIVDLNPANHSGMGSQSSYEWAIRIAGTISRQLHLHRSHVDLVCVGLPDDLVCHSSNRKGVRPIFDFLAMLPHYENLDDANIEDNPDRPAVGRNYQKRFVICTTQTAWSSQIGDAQLITIDNDRFKVDEVDTMQQTEPQNNSANNGNENISITGPYQAFDDLGVGWEGGVSCEL